MHISGGYKKHMNQPNQALKQPMINPLIGCRADAIRDQSLIVALMVRKLCVSTRTKIEPNGALKLGPRST